MNDALTASQEIARASEPDAPKAARNDNPSPDENAAAVQRVRELVAIYLYCPRVNLLDLCL